MPDDGSNSAPHRIEHLSCRERSALKARLIAHAHRERNRLLLEWAGKAIRPLALTWYGRHDAVRAIARRYLARQRRMAELRQLAAMSDLELNDIGISRMEIRAAIRSGGLWPRHGLRASPTTDTRQGEKHAEGLLDRPRLGS